MTLQEYFQTLLQIVAGHPLVVNVTLTQREITEYEGHIEGRLELSNDYQLHVSEYVFTMPQFRRSMYRYHVRNVSSVFVCRWDNAPHYPQIETFPDHFHLSEKTVQPSPPMDIPKALNALTSILI